MGRGSTRTAWFGLAGLATAAAAAVTALTVGVPAALVLDGASARADELQRFGSCAELRRWYADAALRRVTPWGLDGPPVAGPGFFDSAVALAASSGAVAQRAAVANGATGTNIQEAGVDEPDLAKTDGELLALLDGGDLVVVDVTGVAPVELGRLGLGTDRQPQEMLFVGDRVVLLGRISGGAALTTVDISDPSAPTVVSAEDVQGEVVSAREHDGTVRIVVSSAPPLHFTSPDGTTSAREALAYNRQVVRDARTIDWLPTRTAAGGDLTERERGGETGRLVRCGDVRHPDEDSGLGTLTVLTLDPTAPETYETTAVTADGSMVYASDDRLYVATTSGGWSSPWEGPVSVEDRAGPRWTRVAVPELGPAVTDVHAFEVDATVTEYVASGQVRGTAPDRWAFSEHEGRLRVATMLGAEWSPRASAVTVLEESSGDLVEVGRVGGMGRGETIRAVRWFGEVAVVVTFRQTDPLYTLDLSDPTAPRVVGELKIPGFSEYLHPVGGDLLLGVGQDATRRGRTTGSQLSVFDLSDLTRPERVDALSLGRGSSPVEQDSRGFSYLPDRGLALVPTGGWRTRPEIAVVRVAADGALTLVETLAVSGPAATVRALPLPDGRVAVVGGGEALQLVTPG